MKFSSRAVLCLLCFIMVRRTVQLPSPFPSLVQAVVVNKVPRTGLVVEKEAPFSRKTAVHRKADCEQRGSSHRFHLRGGASCLWRSSVGVSPWWPWILLNFVVVLWSSDECLIKHMLDSGQARSPAFLNASRFTVAALIFLVFGRSALWQPKKSALWLSGAELGLWMFLGFATQAIGLQYTTAGRSAFLLYLNVVLVPVLGSACGRTLRRTTWIKAGLALLGTVLLGYDGGQPNIGDAWCLAAAASSALFILRLETAAKQHDAAELNCASMVVIASLCLLWLVHTEPLDSLTPTLAEVGSALYLGIVPTALCSFLQTVGQREIRAESAAIIYTMDPVYTSMLGAAVLGERLGPRGVAGGGLLVFASLLNLISGDPE